MHITFVKKIGADGLPCRKCRDVERRLREADLLRFIDAVAIADERDPASAGLALAREFGMTSAPFFVVRAGGRAEIYSIYLKLVREVLEPLAAQYSGSVTSANRASTAA